MAINFGDLDYCGNVRAEELKERIRGIAYDGIREVLTNWSVDSDTSFRYAIGGIVTVTEMFCEQIDEEVAEKKEKMDRFIQEYQAAQNAEDESNG